MKQRAAAMIPNNTDYSSSTTCPECGRDNHCTKDADCWCMSKPKTRNVPREGACLCERCFDRNAESASLPQATK